LYDLANGEVWLCPSLSIESGSQPIPPNKLGVDHWRYVNAFKRVRNYQFIAYKQPLSDKTRRVKSHVGRAVFIDRQSYGLIKGLDFSFESFLVGNLRNSCAFGIKQRQSYGGV